MGKKIIMLLVFFILGVVFTIILGLMDFLVNKNSIQAGLPLKFTSAALFFGESSTNYFMLLLDILFWTFILWGVWISIKRILGR